LHTRGGITADEAAYVDIYGNEGDDPLLRTFEQGMEE
jgi:hypothetical protein